MERYGTCIVASPGGRSVGGCKSILDGGYSGPSSHISLDMNLCLRSTCLPAGRLLFPSLLLPRLFRPSSCRLPLRHLATLLRRTTSQQRAILRPPSPSCPTTLRRSSLFTAPPPLSLSLSFSRRYFHSSRNPLLPSTEDARGFSPSSVFLSLPFLREDSLQWREFTRDSRVHRMPAPIPSPPSVRLSFVKRLARLTENGTGGGGGGEEGNEMIFSCCDFLEIDWKRSLRRGNRRVLNFQLSFFPEKRRRRRTLRGNESSCDDDESPVEWREVCGVCGEVNGGLG